jgi:hypothetical protein
VSGCFPNHDNKCVGFSRHTTELAEFMVGCFAVATLCCSKLFGEQILIWAQQSYQDGTDWAIYQNREQKHFTMMHLLMRSEGCTRSWEMLSLKGVTFLWELGPRSYSMLSCIALPYRTPKQSRLWWLGLPIIR